jgi:cysteine desulfurase/selenocysteine lyase
MSAWLIRRAISTAITLLAISTLVFAILALAPGDPMAEFATDPSMSREVREGIRRSLGLDQPLYIRYVRWLQALGHGDVGYSFTSRSANIHRGAYAFSRQSTDAYAAARATVARFLNAAPREIVFTRNAIEGLNLIAFAYARTTLQPGDAILITELEHHANDLPWRMVAQERGLYVKRIPLLPDGTLDLQAFEALLTPRVKLLSFAHVSNVLGTITDPAPLVARARANGTVVVLDACQSAPQLPLDVRALDCDFLAFSGHKVFGPTGIRVVYGRAELLAAMPPFLTGGDVARDVGFDDVVWEDAPLRFEAGTPMFVEAIGMAAALEYLQAIGMATVRAHKQELTAYALERFAGLGGVRVFGPRDSAARGGGDRVHGRWMDGAPGRQRPRSVWHRGALRPPLRPSVAQAARCRGDGARQFAISNNRADVDALVDALQALGQRPALDGPEGQAGCRDAG